MGGGFYFLFCSELFLAYIDFSYTGKNKILESANYITHISHSGTLPSVYSARKLGMYDYVFKNKTGFKPETFLIDQKQTLQKLLMAPVHIIGKGLLA